MKVTTKQYIDNQFEWQEKLRQSDTRNIDNEIRSIRQAVEIYRITNDEWKILHNGLQRKMDEQTRTYITWPSLWAVVVGVSSFVLGVAMLFKK